MKVIFLDIDGVLNSENHAKELFELKDANPEKYYDTWDLPYEGTLKPLKKIVEATGAIIVLSSTWRFRRIPLLNKIFKPYGFQIVDKTCNGVYLKTVEELGFDITQCYSVYEYSNGQSSAKYTTDRGAEIAEWLSRHPDVESFVILDDDVADIDQYYKKNHVWTDFYNWGLTEEKADDAISILGVK